MFGTIINSWALFSGFGMIMLAHALQGTLLNINAVVFNFSDFEIGYVFTGYFVGYLFSSIQCPKAYKKCGAYSSFCSFCITRIHRYPFALGHRSSLCLVSYFE
jgi:fucose permease